MAGSTRQRPRCSYCNDEGWHHPGCSSHLRAPALDLSEAHHGDLEELWTVFVSLVGAGAGGLAGGALGATGLHVELGALTGWALGWVAARSLRPAHSPFEPEARSPHVDPLVVALGLLGALAGLAAVTRGGLGGGVFAGLGAGCLLGWVASTIRRMAAGAPASPTSRRVTPGLESTLPDSTARAPLSL